jgi:hypothetical protein
VALLDGGVEAAEEAVAEAVAAAQDDPASSWPYHEEASQLPPARPLGAVLLAPAAGPRGQQPHQQPIGEGGQPKGEHRSRVHAHRARQEQLRGEGPGPGRVVPGARKAQQDAEHVDQPHGQVLRAPKTMAATCPISHTSAQAANSSAATTSQKVSGTELCSG